MTGSHPHEIYSKDATVYLVKGDEKLATLHQAVEQSGFIAFGVGSLLFSVLSLKKTFSKIFISR